MPAQSQRVHKSKAACVEKGQAVASAVRSAVMD